MTMKRYVLPVAFAAIALAPACGRQQANIGSIPTAPVTRRDIVIDAQANGVVEPINIVEVKSKASGLIIRMPVETGTQVRPGDLVIQVDTRDVQNQYNQSAADEKAAEARLQVAAAQKKRSDEMFQSKVITAQEHETAALDFANAEAAAIRARANTDLSKQRLEDATVRASVAGTVIEKTVSEGMVIASATNSVSGGTTLIKMADLSRVRMRAAFNETDIGQIRGGQPAIVIVDAYPERRFNGLVEKIEPQAVVQQGVTMFPVLITLSNTDGALKPGMNGEVQVQIDQRASVLSVPNDAIKNTREAASVAPMLGLDPDSVQAQLRSQFGGRGAARGPGGGTQQGAGRVTTSSPGEVALDPQDRGQGPGQGGGGGRGNFQQVEVTDKQCADVKTAMGKKPDEVKKLDGLRDRMRSGELDRDAMMSETQKLYAAIGVDARVAGACRRREMGGAPGNVRGGTQGNNQGSSAAPAPGANNANGTATPPRTANAATRRDDTQGGTPRQLQVGTERGGNGPRVRPGLVFVQKGKTFEPRVVMLGAANFDYTEVVSGLEEGEQVALLASLTLQAQRQQQNDRMRQNMGGGVPGMTQGGPGGGPGGNPGGGGQQRGGGGR
jgi:HlyD family secretion protein